MYRILLNRGMWLSFSKPIAKAINSNDAALLLAELLNRMERYGYKEIHVPMTILNEELNLSDHKIRKAVNILTKKGLLVVERKGVPAKNFYSLPINFEESVEECLYVSDIKKFNIKGLKNSRTHLYNNNNNNSIRELKEEFDYLDYDLSKIGDLGKAKLLLKDFAGYTFFDLRTTKKVEYMLNTLKELIRANGLNVPVIDAFEMFLKENEAIKSDLKNVNFLSSVIITFDIKTALNLKERGFSDDLMEVYERLSDKQKEHVSNLRKKNLDVEAYLRIINK